MVGPAPASSLHFTPTSGSWLNQVERFFAEITEKRIRRGVFRSVPALEQAIEAYLAASQRGPQAVRVDRHRRPDPARVKRFVNEFPTQDTSVLS